MNRLAEAIGRYHAVEVPGPFRVTTGPEESNEIGERTNEFFQQVVEAFDLGSRALAMAFSIEYRNLSRESMGEEHFILRPTDDIDASLWVTDVQPIASVRTVRDSWNWQVVLFTKYALTGSAEARLARIYNQETL
jgi:hypothetical protein